MKHTLKYIIPLLFLAFGQKVIAQGTINITYQNGNVSNNVWTVDVYGQAGTGYAGSLNMDWSFISIHTDIGVPAGVTIASATAVGNSVYMDQTGFGANPSGPYTSPANTIKLGFQMTRNGQTELTATPVRLGTVTVTFTGGTVTNSTQIYPRNTLNGAGSSWTNTQQTGVRQPIGQSSQFSLPITLVSFNAIKAITQVNLNWVVAAELNAKGYDVQHSADGVNFTSIGFLNATGAGRYNSIDTKPIAGVNYYRLKMVDIDGKFTYSNIVPVNYDGAASPISIWPNPVIGMATIAGLAGTNKIAVVDAGGRQLATYLATSTTKQINLGGFAAGLYTVEITAADGTSTSLKVIKQ